MHRRDRATHKRREGSARRGWGGLHPPERRLVDRGPHAHRALLSTPCSWRLAAPTGNSGHSDRAAIHQLGVRAPAARKPETSSWLYGPSRLDRRQRLDESILTLATRATRYPTVGHRADLDAAVFEWIEPGVTTPQSPPQPGLPLSSPIRQQGQRLYDPAVISHDHHTHPCPGDRVSPPKTACTSQRRPTAHRARTRGQPHRPDRGRESQPIKPPNMPRR
jgi:hypothetical protein